MIDNSGQTTQNFISLINAKGGFFSESVIRDFPPITLYCYWREI